MFRQIKRLSISALGLTLAATIAVPGAALAVGTLDQEQSQQNTFAFTSDCIAQTFTAGLSGKLDLVALYLSDFGETYPLTVEIRSMSSGSPDAVLAAEIRDGTDVQTDEFGWVYIDFAAPPDVTAGTTYAITAKSTFPPSEGGTGAVWGAAAGGFPDGPYTGGHALTASTCAGPWTNIPLNTDMTFRTYVTVPTLDQEQSQQNTFAFTSDCIAQTFTAGLSGKLDLVALYLSDFGETYPLTVEIRSMSSGSPDAVLAAKILDGTDVPTDEFGWVDFDFAAPPDVTAGTTYAITAKSTFPPSEGGTGAVWGAAAGGFPDGPYTGGHALTASTCAGPWTNIPLNTDMTFRTYVTVPAADVQPRGDIGGPCADPAYYGIFDNTASSVALQFRFRFNNGTLRTIKKTVPAGATFRTWEKWVKPFTTMRVGYKNPTTGKWVNLASEESVKGTYPPCDYKRGFTYPDA